jgi:RsmE family RNA methyltransferase
MNIILFESSEAASGFLLPEDPRAKHLLDVLRARLGDSFAAGILNGRKGVMEILSAGKDGVSFRFIPTEEPQPLLPLDIIIGLPRPLVTGRLIKDLTSLGLRALHFVRAGLSEKSYMSGSLWKRHEYRRHLLEGLQQSGNTLAPEIRLHERLDACLACFPAPGEDSCRCVLDPRAKVFLRDIPLRRELVLAIGPERGWTEAELEKFTAAGFLLCGMGQRILRTEAAALAASSVMLSRMGLI